MMINICKSLGLPDRSFNGLVLLSVPQGIKGHTGDLDDLESDSWQITDGVTRSTESSNENFVVLIDETHTTILGHEGSNFLVVLLELHSDTLSDGRVRLLGFNGDLFYDDTSGVR